MVLFWEFLASFVFLLFCIGVFVFSIVTGIESSHPVLVGPAIFPGFISVVLIILSACWLVGLLKKHGFIKVIQDSKNFIDIFKQNKEVATKLSIIFVASIIYVFVLIPLLGFLFATIFFLIPTTMYFGKIKIVHSVLLAVTISYSLHLFFSKVLFLPLP